MDDIMKIVGTLASCYRKMILVNQLKIKKEQNAEFISMLLVTLGANLLENLLPGKGYMAAGEQLV